jgi:hypothetical protein
LITLDVEVVEQIKILATKLNKHHNDILEDVAKDLKKNEGQDQHATLKSG